MLGCQLRHFPLYHIIPQAKSKYQPRRTRHERTNAEATHASPLQEWCLSLAEVAISGSAAVLGLQDHVTATVPQVAVGLVGVVAGPITRRRRNPAVAGARAGVGFLF